MRPCDLLASAGLFVFAACSSPPGPVSAVAAPASAAPVASAAPPPAGASSGVAATPARERSPVLPPAPFSIIARGPKDHHFVAFPLDGGEALVALAPDAKKPVVARWARLAKDAISLAPDLATGLPPLAFDDLSTSSQTDELIAGSFGGGLWLAHGTPCVVHEWQPGGWVVRAPDKPVTEPCMRLSAWTEGAALAAFSGAEWRAYGKAPKVLPKAATSTKPDCGKGPISSDYQMIRGFHSGEVVAVGRSVCLRQAVLERWAKGAARSTTGDGQIDLDGPFTVAIPSPNEIVIQGAGSLPSKPGEEIPVVIHHHFAKGRFTSATSATTAGSVNALEEWLTNFPAKMGPIASGKEDGWNYHSFRLTEGDEIFVTGWIMRDGKAAEAVLLRNRPVAAEARFGN